MDQANVQDKVRRLEQELQFRVPGNFSIGAVGGGFNARGSTEALNYRSPFFTQPGNRAGAQQAKQQSPSAAAAAAQELQRQQQQRQSLLRVSNVASMQDEPSSVDAADSVNSDSRATSHVFSDFTEDEDSDEGADGGGGKRPDSPTDFEEVPLDTPDGSGGGGWRSTAAAAIGLGKSGQPQPQPGQKAPSLTGDRKSAAAGGGMSEYIDVKISDSKHPPAELPPQPEGLEGNRLKRRKVFESLLATEASYLASLRELLDVYEQPLMKHRPKLLPRRATRLIFYKIRELHQIHRILQISLHAAALGWDSNERVGHILSASFSRGMVLKTYASFLNNYPRSVDAIRRLMKDNAPFASFLGAVQRRSSHKLPLMGTIVKPVQRFPQLLLVVKDLLKFTEPDHPDRYDLLYAQTQIEHLTSQLNDIKRDSEQLIAAKQLLRALGIHSKSALRNSSIRIMREDDATELRTDVAPSASAASHDGSRRLILTTYYVLCTSAKRKGGPHELLWYARLEDVRLSATSLTPDMRVNLEEVSSYMRIISQRNSEVPEELEEIYNNLHSLLHDHAVMVKILSLVSSLKFIYPDVREDRLQSLLANMQVAIQQKSEELRVAQGTVLSLTIRREASGKGSKHERKAFDMLSCRSHDAWIRDFTSLRLALQPANNAAWITETLDDLEMQAHQRTPLLVGVKACDLNRAMFQVTCATPVCLLNGSILKTHLWCAASDGSVTMFSLYDQNLEMTETFRPVGAYVTAVAVVPGCPTSSQNKEDEIWMATDSAEIFVHSTVEARRRESRKKVDLPATLTSLLCLEKSVFGGDVNGNLICFNQNLLGNWNLSDPEVQSVADWPLKNLTISQDGKQLLMSSGPCLIALELESLRLVSRTDLSEEDTEGNKDDHHVRSFLLAGEGVWVCYENRPSVRLYYGADMRLVQTFDIRPAFNKVNAKTRLHPEGTVPAATAIAVTRGMLWVGTSVGLLYLLRTPRLESGVPVAFGPPLICCHSHRGPITTLLTYRNIKDTVVSSVTFDEQDEEDGGDADADEDSDDSAGLDSAVSTSGLYQLDRVVDQAAAAAAAEDGDADPAPVAAATATTPESAARRKSTTVARLAVAPNMQRWASNPNLLISEQRRTGDSEGSPEVDMRKLYGSLMDLDGGRAALVDIDFDDSEEAAEAVAAAVAEAAADANAASDNGSLSDIAEEEADAAADAPDGAAEPTAQISRVGPEIVVSFGPGYRDLMHRAQCSGEEGASLMAFYAPA